MSRIYSRLTFSLLVLLTMMAASASSAYAQMDPAIQRALGVPDRSTAGRDWHQHLLIERPQYALVYNNETHFPDWVAWHLSRQDFGSVGRGQFVPDYYVTKAGYVVIMPKDYEYSGYDRGHNCPSADRTASTADNDAVFLMTNITPQARDLNVGPWRSLETYCRRLVEEGNELFIYCGHSFSSPTHRTIGANKIAVPDFGWKIVVVVPPGEGDPLRRITPTTRVIAVKMPNTDTVSRGWREYRVSVRDIEKATGLVFFDALSRATAASLKDRVDGGRTVPSHGGVDDQRGRGITQAQHFFVGLLVIVVFSAIMYKELSKRNSITRRLFAIAAWRLTRK